ncbi:calcium-binding protein [Gemmobacter serpentinus]|uniref:calcium-binding protein n=1 Tax=Gemmobacter serpentinus TaxID=2652247 RepID=UPI001CF62245|nr:hypothetical protein [Gemmobacter serpentinus]
MTPANMLGFGLAALPAATTDVLVTTDIAIPIAGVTYDSSVAYTLGGRTTTFYGIGLEVMTASTGGPLHFTLSGGELGAVRITDSTGGVMQTSITGLVLDVASTLFDRFNGPEIAFMQALLGGADSVTGSAGDDSLRGFGGADLVLGRGGNDAIYGGNGNDNLRGGGGDDTLRGDAGNDRLTGDAGNDQLIGGQGNDRLNGKEGNDRLLGGFGNDWLSGEAGNDMLRGDDGRDTVMGGLGRDTIIGGTQDDRLTGGAGADTFVLRVGHGNDTITDFVSGVDKVQIQLGDSDPSDVAIRFRYAKGDCEVSLLGMTLTLLDVAPNSLNFDKGGDFLLVQI